MKVGSATRVVDHLGCKEQLLKGSKSRPKVNVNEFLLNSFAVEFNKLYFDYEGETAGDIYTRFHKNFRRLYDK